MSGCNKKLNKALMNLIRDEKLLSSIRLKKVMYLVRLGADVHACLCGKSMLSWAKAMEDEEVSLFLEKKGAKEFQIPSDEVLFLNKRLIEAIKGKEEIEVIQNLIKKGADFEYKNKLDGKTALLVAVNSGRTDVVKMLLDEGADIEAYTSSKLTSLMIAAYNGYTEVVELLLENGAKVNSVDKYDYTALMVAISNEKSEVAKMLLDKGCDVKKSDALGRTALHIAVSNGLGDVVKMLLDSGVDVNAKDCDGSTALILACSKGDKEMVKLILEKDVDIEARNKEDETALTIANSLGHKEVVEMLGEKLLKSKEKRWNMSLRNASSFEVGEFDNLLNNDRDLFWSMKLNKRNGR